MANYSVVIKTIIVRIISGSGRWGRMSNTGVRLGFNFFNIGRMVTAIRNNQKAFKLVDIPTNGRTPPFMRLQG